jgi:hypothetical protein
MLLRGACDRLLVSIVRSIRFPASEATGRQWGG